MCSEKCASKQEEIELPYFQKNAIMRPDVRHMFFFKGAPQESRGSMHPCVRTGLEHLTHQLEVQGHGITMFEEHVTAPVILHENE